MKYHYRSPRRIDISPSFDKKKNNPQHLLQLSNNLPVRKTKLSYLKTFLAVLMMSAEE
jgi:hypothetical protein